MLPYNGWLLVLSACILASIIYASVADCTGRLARGCDIPDNLLLVPRLAYFWIAYAIGHLPVSVEHVVALSPHRCRKAHACRDCHLCCYYWACRRIIGVHNEYCTIGNAEAAVCRPVVEIDSHAAEVSGRDRAISRHVCSRRSEQERVVLRVWRERPDV